MPQPNTDATDKSYTNSYGYTACKSNADGYSYNNTTTPDADCDAHTHGDPASADAKAAAHAVSSADAAVTASERVKRLKELKSNRELARQLASSLLSGGKRAI